MPSNVPPYLLLPHVTPCGLLSLLSLALPTTQQDLQAFLEMDRPHESADRSER